MKDADFRIRPASLADVMALAALMERSYRYAFSAILSAAALATRDTNFFAERFQAQYESLHLAEDRNGAVIGLIQVRNGNLDLIFVDEKWIGRGAGRALLEKAVVLGAEMLECFSANKEARRFYERAGWTIAERYSREFAGEMHDFVLYRRPD